LRNIFYPLIHIFLSRILAEIDQDTYDQVSDHVVNDAQVSIEDHNSELLVDNNNVNVDNELEIDSDSDDDVHDTMRKDLKERKNVCEVKVSTVDKLLKILKQHGHQDLPASNRTLLKTPRTGELGFVSNTTVILGSMLC
jgi:polyphosphate kinase